MTNPFFNNSTDLLPNTRARAGDVESKLEAVEAGFDAVDVALGVRDTAINLKAPIASPTFTGDPKAPNQADGDNDTSLANTAFVQRAIALAAALSLPSVAGQAGRFLSTDGSAVFWEIISKSETVSLVSTPTTMVRYTTYVLTASTTLTLPASPAAGDWVVVINRSATVTAVIARNAQNIMGLAENMTMDDLHAGIRLVFADATRGWVLA